MAYAAWTVSSTQGLEDRKYPEMTGNERESKFRGDQWLGKHTGRCTAT